MINRFFLAPPCILLIVILVTTISGCNPSRISFLVKSNPAKDYPETVARGQAIFAAHCAECHGPTARGGLSFPEVIPDLVEFAAANSENKIAYRIASGAFFHMPQFDVYLTEKEIWDVTNYLKHIAAEEQF